MKLAKTEFLIKKIHTFRRTMIAISRTTAPAQMLPISAAKLAMINLPPFSHQWASSSKRSQSHAALRITPEDSLGHLSGAIARKIPQHIVRDGLCGKCRNPAQPDDPENQADPQPKRLGAPVEQAFDGSKVGLGCRRFLEAKTLGLFSTR